MLLEKFIMVTKVIMAYYTSNEMCNISCVHTEVLIRWLVMKYLHMCFHTWINLVIGSVY